MATIDERTARTTRIGKDVDDDLPYQFDYTDWLTTGETLTAAELTVEKISDGSTIEWGVTGPDEEGSIDAGVVTSWIRPGGADGTEFEFVCRATSSNGRDRTLRLRFRLSD